MANVNYDLNNTNKGLRGGIKYLDDFGENNFDLQDFQEKMENVTKEAVTTNLDNSVIEVTDFDSLQIPGNYFIRFTSGTGHKPTDRTGGYGSLIVKNIGNTYLEQILTTYYKNKMHQYKRRAIKNGNSWSFTIGGEEEDKNNKALWVRTYNNSAIIPLEDGGTGTSFSTAPDNALIIKKTVTKDEESKPQLDYKKTNKGALHCKTQADEANNQYPEISFGTLPIDCGGTGLTSSPSLQVNLASTNSDTILKVNSKPGVTGVLPLDHGGTGTNFLDYNNIKPYAIIRTSSDLEHWPQLYYTNVGEGAFYTKSKNSELQFGRLPLTYGGTGADFSEIPSCAIIRASSNLNSYPSLSYTPTEKGAVYVETNSGELKFGTLDIEYGGTGETSKPTYQVLSDNYYDKPSIVSNATIKFKYIPYLNLTYVNMQFTIEPTQSSSISENSSFQPVIFKEIFNAEGEWNSNIPELIGKKSLGGFTALSAFCPTSGVDCRFRAPFHKYKDSDNNTHDAVDAGIYLRFDKALNSISTKYYIYCSGLIPMNDQI